MLCSLTGDVPLFESGERGGEIIVVVVGLVNQTAIGVAFVQAEQQELEPVGLPAMQTDEGQGCAAMATGSHGPSEHVEERGGI